MKKLSAADRLALQWSLIERWDARLDACRGACALKRAEVSKIVADSLLKFDGVRYELTDFVVMPNHLHVLAAFRDEESLRTQCAGWKRYTARQINHLLGRRGEFWQVDAFDHLVRNPSQLEKFRAYIAANGASAGLKPGEYHSYSKASL